MWWSMQFCLINRNKLLNCSLVSISIHTIVLRGGEGRKGQHAWLARRQMTSLIEDNSNDEAREGFKDDFVHIGPWR